MFADVTDNSGRHMRLVERDGEVFHQKIFSGNGRAYDEARQKLPHLPERDGSVVYAPIAKVALGEFLDSNPGLIVGYQSPM